MEEKLRRCCEVLRISGTAVVVFGVWSIVKSAVVIIMQWNVVSEILNLFAEANINIMPWVFAILGVLAADILLRIVTWRGSAAESRGTRSGIIYVICAVILLSEEVYGVVYTLINFDPKYSNIIDTVIQTIVSSTAAFAVFAVILYAFKVKRLKKRIKKEGGAACS